MGPHPLLRSLPDEGLELRLKRGRPCDRIRRMVVGAGHVHALGADYEAHLRLAEGGAGIERQPGLASEESGKNGRKRRSAEKRNGRAVVVAEIGEERGIAPALRRLHKRPRAHWSLRQKASLVKESAQLAGLLVDKGIAKALIDPSERGAHELAGVGDQLPIAEMKPTDHTRSAADDLFESLLRFEPD